MTVDSLHAEPTTAADSVTSAAATPAPGSAVLSVRLCDACGRPLPALHKDEYTTTRAYIVASVGVCVCPSSDSAGIPARGPSLL